MYSIAVVLALAASPAPAPSSPRLAVTIAAFDAQYLPKKDARFYRYLWVPSSNKDLENDLVTLGFHFNLLSDQGEFGPLVLVAPSVIRIDTRYFGWDNKLDLYEKLRDIDFYFNIKMKLLKDVVIEEAWPGGKQNGKDYEYGVYDDVKKKAGDTITVSAPWLPYKEIVYLRHKLYTEVPVLNAEWFFIQTARQISIRNKDEGVGYYNWLGLKTRNDFFKLTGTDEKTAIRIFSEWRAVVEKSGISQQGRQIVALGSTSGRVWGTLDAFSQVGRGQPKRNLRRGEFLHDAEEWYGFLPNGLFVTFLSNKDGVAQASAPDQIGPDDSPLREGRDPRVHANLSCIRCHGIDKEMLKPVKDWARKTFRQGGLLKLTDPDKKVELELKSQYLRDLDRLLTADRLNYTYAIARVTATKTNPKGLTSVAITNLYGNYWNRYVEKPVTLEVAARELGVWKWKLKAAIIRYTKLRGQGDLILSAFIDEPEGTITRLEWEDGTYALAQTIVHDLHPPEIPEKTDDKKDKKKEDKK